MNIKYLLELSRDNFLFWLSRKIDYPLVPPDFIQVNLTCRCNLRCKMCDMHNHMQLLKNRGERIEIDSDTFKKIIRESAEMRIKKVLLCGGEPFVREDLFDLVRYAKHLDLAVIIITNGTLLNKKVIEQCFESKVDYINISIDAAFEQTYSRIREENVLRTIIENVTNLKLLKEEKCSNYPSLSAICTIMNDNLEELLDVISLCKKIGIDSIAFQPVVTSSVNQGIREFHSSVLIPPSRFPILDKATDELIEYKRQNPNFIWNGIESLALLKSYFRRELSLKNTPPCYVGYNRLQISQDYVMCLCAPSDNQYKNSFGDVSKVSLKDLWYSESAKIRRKLIKKCNTPCLQCCSYRYESIKLSEIIKGFINK